MQPQLLLASHSPREFKISPRLQKQPSLHGPLQDPEGLTHVFSQPHELYSFPFLSQYSSKIKKQNRDATSSKKLFSEQTLMWGTRWRESQKARADGTSKKKKVPQGKGNRWKRKGKLARAASFNAVLCVHDLRSYVFTACMGTFLACSQTFFFLSLPPENLGLSERGERAIFLSHALSTIFKERIEGLWMAGTLLAPWRPKNDKKN